MCWPYFMEIPSVFPTFLNFAVRLYIVNCHQFTQRLTTEILSIAVVLLLIFHDEKDKKTGVF